MSLYKQKLNTRTGQFNLVPSGLVITFKPGVANVAALPAVGNTQNDARITNDAGHLYVWDNVSWVDQGDIIDLNWTAISGRPSSSVADIDDAVQKKHSPGTDTTMGAMTADLDMNDHDIINLKDDSIKFKSGGSITKVDYVDSVNNTKASFVKSAIAFPPVSAVSGDKYLITPPASGLFTAAGGSVGDYLTIPITSTLKPGSGEFCYEIDLTLDIMPTVFDSLVGQYENANAKRVWRLGVIPAGGGLYQWRFDYSINGIAAISKFYNDTITTGIKYRICIQRTGNDLKFFRDGVQLGITADMTGVTLFDTDAKLTIATYGGIGGISNPNGAYCHQGRLGEVRMSNISRYAGNYTPSTIINAVDANTILLLHCFGTDGSTTFTDECGNPVTAHRNAHIDTGDYFRTTIWTPNVNDIAVYNGATYDFITKKAGLISFVDDENKTYFCDGTNWSATLHTQNTDQYLDYGGVNQVGVNEIVKKSTNTSPYIIYYVNCDTGNDTNAGTVIAPFQTIQHAINLIPNFSNGNYYIIYLQDSLNYNENIKIIGKKAADISIRSVSMDRTKVLITKTGNYNVFDISGSDSISLQYLSIRVNLSGYACASAVDGTNLRVDECAFGDVSGTTFGIILSQSTAKISTVYNIDANKVFYGIDTVESIVIYNTSFSFGDTFIRNERSSIVTDSINLIKTDYDDAITKKHSPNTDTGASGTFDVVGEFSMKVYSQAAEPTLGADNRMAIWIDSDDSNRVYLLFRRGSGDQVAVELG